MASLDEEIRLDEEENRRELAFIRTQLPLDVKKFYSDKDILYMMDLIVDYYYTSGILESKEDEVEILVGKTIKQLQDTNRNLKVTEVKTRAASRSATR